MTEHIKHMKQITVVGASRGVGLLTVQQALAKGHRVVALSQNLDTLPEHANLTKMKGSATNASDIAKAITASDAVIVTIGTRALGVTTLYSQAARSILQAFKATGSQAPLIVLTGFGAGESGKYQGFVTKLLFSLLLKKVYADKTVMEEIITASSTNWEIVRPGRLVDKPLTGTYKQYLSLEPGMKIGAIARADVAHFLVAQAESPSALKKYVGLTS